MGKRERGRYNPYAVMSMARKGPGLIPAGRFQRPCAAGPAGCPGRTSRGVVGEGQSDRAPEAGRTAVLVITSDDDLIARLSRDPGRDLAFRFARTAYQASAVIRDFRPEFAVVDRALAEEGETDLMDCLARDPRIPRLRIILGVPHGMAGKDGDGGLGPFVAGVIDKPFGARQVASVVHSFPAGRPAGGDAGPCFRRR